MKVNSWKSAFCSASLLESVLVRKSTQAQEQHANWKLEILQILGVK